MDEEGQSKEDRGKALFDVACWSSSRMSDTKWRLAWVDTEFGPGELAPVVVGLGGGGKGRFFLNLPRRRGFALVWLERVGSDAIKQTLQRNEGAHRSRSLSSSSRTFARRSTTTQHLSCVPCDACTAARL